MSYLSQKQQMQLNSYLKEVGQTTDDHVTVESHLAPTTLPQPEVYVYPGFTYYDV